MSAGALGMSVNMLPLPSAALDRAGAARLLAQVDGWRGVPGFARFRKLLVGALDNWRCYLCGRAVGPRSATIDHVQPLSRGGADVPANWRAACLTCNQAKGSATLAEYLAGQAVP